MDTEAVNSLEELYIMQAATLISFAKVFNLPAEKHIYCHPQIDYLTVSQPISVARHARRFKLTAIKIGIIKITKKLCIFYYKILFLWQS